MTIDVAKKHRDQLERLKNNIENAHDAFKENIDRYNEFRNFVFVTTQTQSQINVLATLQKPQIEFNILEAYISRLRGEFSKQEPSIQMSAKPGQKVDPQLIEIIEGHVRYTLQEANKAGLEYHCYTDTLSGGYSAMKVYADYSGEKSFHLDIFLRRCYDPTLTGFDPTAMREDKADAEYCFEIFAKRKTDLEREYPNVKFESITKATGPGPHMGNFQWSYNMNDDEVYLVADYYEKKKTRKTIIQLSDGQVLTNSEYDKFLEDWAAEGKIEQAPIPVGKPRTTDLVTVERYRLVGDQVLEHEETDYKRLPLIFIDGNSILSKKNTTGVVRQMTRPYIYNAKGAQAMLNYHLQTLCNEVENLGPAKLAVPKDGIPPAYLENYLNPQNSLVYVYNQFRNDDPNVPLNPPIPMTRQAIPPEVPAGVEIATKMISNILGSFDTSMAHMTQDQMSGKAVQEVSTLSNSAAMPYVVSFMRGLQSAAQLIVDLIPLYYTTPRTIPIIDKQGNKSYVKINQEGGISLDYDHDAIQVNVEAGVSFGLQQERALQQISMLMHASPAMAQFFGEDGMKHLFKNMSFRGVEVIEEDVERWVKQQMQAKQMMQQAEMQKPKIEQQALQVAAQQVQVEAQVGMAKVQQQAQAEQVKAQLKAAELQMDEKRIQMDLIKALAQMRIEEEKLGIEQQRADDDRIETVIDAAIRQSEHVHGMSHKEFERNLSALESDRGHEINLKGLESKAEKRIIKE